MAGRKLRHNWPTRPVDLSIGRVKLQLQVPDNPYAMLDLPGVEQAFADDEYMPYWAHLWPAGFMLADWLSERVATGRTDSLTDVPLPPVEVLDIGCGLGVVGLVAAGLGYRVTLSDYDEDALDFVRQNARSNGLAVRVAFVDWREPPARRYPLILAADVLYEQRSHGPVLEMLRLSLAGGGLAALADPCRQVADHFDRDAMAAGWQVRAVATRWQDAPGRIFLLRRQQACFPECAHCLEGLCRSSTP